MTETKQTPPQATPETESLSAPPPTAGAPEKAEHGGPKGLEPTRFGDWERNGRCFDF